MRFRRPPAEEIVPSVPAPEPGTPFEGAHCFASDGFHYPVLFDADGNDLGPDRSRPLVYRGETLLHAYPDDNSHFHEYGLQEKELEVGGE